MYVGEQYKVLVVDDKEINRKVLRKILSETYEVLEAENGKQALEVLEIQQHQIAAVLLDISMPIMNGYEFLKIVRDSDEFINLPIIAITGIDIEETEEKVLEAGVNDYLEKPFKPEIIKIRLGNAIRLRQALDSAELDGLTQLLNRTAFRQKFELYMNGSGNQMPQAAMLMIDLDDFKQTNDTYGHAYGDLVLSEFGASLKEVCSSQSLLGRLGGDEFIVLIKDVKNVEEVKKIAQDIIHKLNITVLKEGARPSTCSIGIVISPKDGTTWSELYFRADEAMYHAKHIGKNQFSFYGDAITLAERNEWMNKEWILDAQDSYIYVCNAITHEVYYCNAKCKKLIETLPEEMERCFCFQLGLADTNYSFCATCPLEGDSVCSKIQYSSVLGQKVLYSGILVSWNGCTSRMVTVSAIPKC